MKANTSEQIQKYQEKIPQKVFLRKAQRIKRTDTLTKRIIIIWEEDIRRAARVSWFGDSWRGKEPAAKLDTGEPKNIF